MTIPRLKITLVPGIESSSERKTKRRWDAAAVFTSFVSLFLALYARSIVRSRRTSWKHPRYTAPGMRDGEGVLGTADGAGVLEGGGVTPVLLPHSSKGS